jgi:hypothetical protein
VSLWWKKKSSKNHHHLNLKWWCPTMASSLSLAKNLLLHRKELLNKNLVNLFLNKNSPNLLTNSLNSNCFSNNNNSLSSNYWKRR